MVMEKIIIKGALGIHLRPAGMIASEGQKYHCKIELYHKERSVNGKSLLSILSLGVRKGGEVEIRCDGSDEEKALAAMIKVISEADDPAAWSSMN